MDIFALLFTLLILAAIIYVVILVVDMLALPYQLKTIALIIICLVFLFHILTVMGIGVPRL